MSTLEISADEARSWIDSKRYGWLPSPALPLIGVLSIIAVAYGVGLKKLLVVHSEASWMLLWSQIASRSMGLSCTETRAELLSSHELTTRWLQS